MTKDLVQMLDLEKTIDQMAKANGVRRHRLASRENKNNLLRKALNFVIQRTMKRGR